MIPGEGAVPSRMYAWIKKAVMQTTGTLHPDQKSCILSTEWSSHSCTVVYNHLPAATSQGREEARRSLSFTPLLTHPLKQQKPTELSQGNR